MKRKPPSVIRHGLIIRWLFRVLDAFCQTHTLGEVITELPYVLAYNSKWVKGARVPDLMFFAKARWEKYIAETKDYLDKPFILVPDLAVEVVSAHDLYTEIQAKVDIYRADGVRLIWIVDSIRKKVTVYEGAQYAILSSDEMLTGGQVLPALEIKLAELFA